ncbi:MAG: hypothetical protein ACRCXC_04425 [Legionella sp.]
MKLSIPAKTFLLGEYAAIAGASAIVLTTSPCFELTLSPPAGLTGIHPDSPAGRWWQQQLHAHKEGLTWHDPYAGRGGLGASSAQFLGSYLARCFLEHKTPYLNHMLDAYYQSSWMGKGLKPSGYDVIAQAQQGCVYINKQKELIKSYAWPFEDVSFFLIHTGVKLATHHHLQDTSMPDRLDFLSSLVDEAEHAFEKVDSKKLIAVINAYNQELTHLNLVAEHSLALINQFKEYPKLLAIKGCGALGADVLLLITSSKQAPILFEQLRHKWTIIATEKNIFLQDPLIKS